MNEFEKRLLEMLSRRKLSATQIFHVLEMSGDKKTYHHISRTLSLLEKSMYLDKTKRGKETYYKTVTATTTHDLHSTSLTNFTNKHALT